ncbi:MAG: Holliday junction branch migration protein RuvA [Candidatus Sericytochromatia bacterium]
MYNFIKGKVDEIFIDTVSIENNGIGYLIHIPKRFCIELKHDDEVKIFTTLIHREDTMKLVGFKTKEEREVFNLLNSVSGVGTKTALGVLSEFTSLDIITAIYSNDAKKLAKAPGIGLKTAQRIILELKEKISTFKNISSEEIKTEIKVSSDKLEQLEETESVLIALGYSNNEIKNAIDWLLKTFPNLSKSDDMIRECLSFLSN